MLSLRQLLACSLVMASGCMFGLLGCAAPQPLSQPMPDLEKAGLHELWQHQIPLMPGENVVRIWRVGDSIYVNTSDASLLRFSAAEGTLKWQVDLRNPEYRVYRPAEVTGGKHILVVNHGKAFLID